MLPSKKSHYQSPSPPNHQNIYNKRKLCSNHYQIDIDIRYKHQAEISLRLALNNSFDSVTKNIKPNRKRNETSYLTGAVKRIFAAAIDPVNFAPRIVDVAGASGAHRVDGAVLEHDQRVRTVTAGADRRLLLIDNPLLPIPRLSVRDNASVQVEALAPANPLRDVRCLLKCVTEGERRRLTVFPAVRETAVGDPREKTPGMN